MPISKKTKEITNKRLVLLDSHAILHRAYHALPDFASSKGEPTGALFGLSTMLMRIIELFKPDYIIACFDLPKPTYRHEAYEGYKAGRKKADDELVSQIIRSRDVFKAFSIPSYELEGFEADDMLGTIVEELKDREDVDIVIASGDMDTMQLIKGEKVKVFTLKKGIKDTIIYDEKEVLARFGFEPKLLCDYKGLRGDPSDNIVGIAGIGEKTATSLIKEFGTIEDMYDALESGATERFKKAGVSDRMVEIIRNNKEEALFSKMLATIRRDAPIEFVFPEKSWKESVSISDVKSIFSDLDFRSLMARADTVLGKCAGKEETCPPLASPAGEGGREVDEIELKKISIALWLLNSSITNPTLADILNFAKTDSFSKAREIILAAIKNNGFTKVYEEIELPLIPVVEKMQKRGVKIDRKYLKKLSDLYHKKLYEIEKNIFELAEREFNVASPKQLGEILYTHLGLSVKNQKKTSTGAKSTKESELEKMKDLHPIIPFILEHRELSKLLGTYIDAIPELLDEGSRLHTTFMQAGTTTGRMSSEKPNLQNIPIKTELGRNIRNAFISDEKFVLASFDYSQIELRIAAMLSNDEKLIDIFKKGEDVHKAVASQVFKVPLEKVDKEMRRKAKVINFGIIYGMGVNALKDNLGGTRDEAKQFYDEYFRTFSKLAEFLDQTKVSASNLGYTTTMYGRRRYFEGIHSKLPFIKAAAERMAINAPIQGTQADIVKIAMCRINTFLEKEKLSDSVFPMLQIHDELIFEIKENIVKDVLPKIKDIMHSVMDGVDTKGVPIVTNGYVGKNWGEMIESL